MTTFGISMVKNEGDIIEDVINHTLTQVDHIIVADNLSTDNTREILSGFGDKITLLDDKEVGYYQSKKMTALAHEAHRAGADWVIPFDADEIWFSPSFDTISEHLQSISDEFVCVAADWYHHAVTVIDDPDEINVFKRMRFRLTKPSHMRKVAARCDEKLVIEQGNHGIQYGGAFWTSNTLLEARHFPYRTLEQFMSKVVNGNNAYVAAPDLPAQMGTHWKEQGSAIEKSGIDKAKELFNNTIIYDMSGMVEDPAPIRGLN